MPPKNLPVDHLFTHLVGIHHFHSRLLVWRASAHELAEVGSIPASTLGIDVSQCSIEVCCKLYVGVHHKVVHPSCHVPAGVRGAQALLELITVFCQWLALTNNRSTTQCAESFLLQHHRDVARANWYHFGTVQRREGNFSTVCGASRESLSTANIPKCLSALQTYVSVPFVLVSYFFLYDERETSHAGRNAVVYGTEVCSGYLTRIH